MDLEEALAQADVYAEESEVCVIDAVTRTINVPTKFQLLGVENDKKVDRIPFRCPKIVGDNKDLSQDFILFINYVNANGDPDAYKIEDMQVDGDNITFSWLLEEKVTLYQGIIQISFCGIIPGDGQEAPDKNRWGTTINTDCNVLTGLKCTQQVTESNPDALAQIWAVIDELKAGGSDPGTPGKDGVGISNIAKTDTAGLVDTYTITMTDSTSYTFTVKNGEDGDPGQDGITPTIGENGNWYLGDDDTGKPSCGKNGVTPNLQIGEVTTLEPGEEATAEITGAPETPLLNLGIPRGQDSSSGSATGGESVIFDSGDKIVQIEEDVLEIIEEFIGISFNPQKIHHVYFSVDMNSISFDNLGVDIYLPKTDEIPNYRRFGTNTKLQNAQYGQSRLFTYFIGNKKYVQPSCQLVSSAMLNGAYFTEDYENGAIKFYSFDKSTPFPLMKLSYRVIVTEVR